MRQEQDGGEGSANYQAGRDIVNNGLTLEVLNELKKHLDGQVVGEVERQVLSRMEALKDDFVRFTGEANERATRTALHLLTMFVEQLAVRAPQNIESIKTVWTSPKSVEAWTMRSSHARFAKEVRPGVSGGCGAHRP